MTKSRPVLLSPAEIHLLLAGSDCITRQVEENLPPETNAVIWGYMERKYVPWNLPNTYIGGVKTGPSFVCPFGVQEDQLWVKESVWLDGDSNLLRYDADITEEERKSIKAQGGVLQRATHMRQAFSRLILTVKKIEAVKNEDSSWSWNIKIERNS